MRVRKLCCGNAFLVGGVKASIADIVHYCSGEQVGILEHKSQGAAEVRLLYFVDIDIVVAYFSVLDIVEAVDKVRDGGLSGTG